ncbi:MAG: valine--tRNA ligase [Campylobacterales bacterium]|nr:valine--tRNA ligase [Campylobacterales bacterium]
MSEKKYFEPQEIEDKYYQIWESRNYFEPKNEISDKTFCIMMPPPNVTGSLHIGHALTFTLQDILVRYKRMDGFKTLWQPGTDHAGIATQNVVEKQLLKEGTTKEELGREEFLNRVWKWKEYSGGTIVNQMRKLGVTPAWSRERFTMDDGLKESVKKAFVELYHDGYIVRGNYMINWCTHDGALSDIEVEYEEHKGHMYHIRYFFSNSNDYIVVATTRPETYFGDTAIMVNPNDERYKHLIGQKVKLPIIEKEIEIIADEHVDMEFGTGVVKVTPAHDTNDYEVGKRHNLEFITIFNEAGVLNHHCGEFEGLERIGARSVIVKKLEELGFLEKIEEHTHQVGHCYRCKNVVEPYISKQWFVKKELALKAIEKVNLGEAKFFPSSWKNNYDAWMRELRDWCISRQLWWGHRIPVFYCHDCEHEFATTEDSPKCCPKCNSTHFHQDKDVLDTWFSSALWPFSTLGWGNSEKSAEKYGIADIKEFYPNSVLITGFDILFFWVARMMMMGTHFLGDVPFKDIYLHALVRDEHGQKMSKSKGNVIDPLDLIGEFSADALRFTLAFLCIQGRDIKIGKQSLDLAKTFMNKLFNATKFLLMNVEKFDDLENVEVKSYLGKYMLSRFNRCVKEVRDNLDSYRFNDATSTIYKFLWNEFCDWGIELSKADKSSINELGSIFKESMKLLNPIMPFISEYLYHELNKSNLEESESIIIQKYPTVNFIDEAIEHEFEIIIDSIVAIRRAKVTVELANQKIEKAYVKSKMDLSAVKHFIELLAKVENIEFVADNVENSIKDISEFAEVFIPVDKIDLKPIVDRLTKQDEKIQKEIDKLSSMMNNEKFIANAPKQLVEENRAKLIELEEKSSKIKDELKSLRS